MDHRRKRGQEKWMFGIEVQGRGGDDDDAGDDAVGNEK